MFLWLHLINFINIIIELQLMESFYEEVFIGNVFINNHGFKC